MKLAVVGPGLIGRSVALAARRAHPDTAVVEVDRGDPLDRIAGADIVVLAAPVEVILHVLASGAELLRTPLTIDTGSTKRQIVAAARAQRLERFIGGHPMTGAATAGSEGARADLFDGRPWFLATRGADAGTAARAIDFVTALGARPVVLEDDGAEHDRVMAAVSHLPQVVASTLMAVAADSAGERLSWAGPGLRDTTRLAASSASMWQGILSSNAEEIAPLLHEVARRLQAIAGGLHDPTRVQELFDQAHRARDRLTTLNVGSADVGCNDV